MEECINECVFADKRVNRENERLKDIDIKRERVIK